MKNTCVKVMAIVMVLLVVGIISAPQAFAQDPLAVAPGMYELLYENDKVRVMQVAFEVGEQIAEHSHPDHFAYVLEAGSLKISKPDGTSTDVELKLGEIIWMAAESHSAINIGTTPVRLLVVELK